MTKSIHKIIEDVLLKSGWHKNKDGSITHPYEGELKSSSPERLRRNIRLIGRPRR